MPDKTTHQESVPKQETPRPRPTVLPIDPGAKKGITPPATTQVVVPETRDK